MNYFYDVLPIEIQMYIQKINVNNDITDVKKLKNKRIKKVSSLYLPNYADDCLYLFHHENSEYIYDSNCCTVKTSGEMINEMKNDDFKFYWAHYNYILNKCYFVNNLEIPFLVADEVYNIKK